MKLRTPDDGFPPDRIAVFSVRDDSWVPSAGNDLEASSITPVILLRIDGRASARSDRSSAPNLGEAIRQLRRAHPHLLITGQTPDVPHSLGAAICGALAPYGLRVWFPEAPTGDVLRTVVGRAGVRRSDVLAWLNIRLRPKGVTERGAIVSLGSALSGEAVGVRRGDEVTRWAGKLGLPPRRAWATAGRLLRAIVQLQSDADLTIAQVARRHDFADDSSFSHSFRRTFGITPSVARVAIGWEFLLTNFLDRSPDGVLAGTGTDGLAPRLDRVRKR